LRPPALDELGLVSAIREQAAQYTVTNGLHVSVIAPENYWPALPAAVEVAAYRIALEALTNVARHAQASSCEVRIACDGALTLEIIDNGIGLSSTPHSGVGLQSMRERAAELGGACIIESVVGDGGTRVFAQLPLPAI
jgi:signal transduction histidine kinase